jgi:16S rRNA processing protein RimM
MEKSDCLEVGRIIKTFGYKGELIARIGKEFIGIIKNEGSVFIETDEELVPYFINELEHSEEDFYSFCIDDITSVDEAKSFNGSILWIPSDKIPKGTHKENPLQDITGYSVTDVNFGELGKADEVLEYPKHFVLRILKGKKEILLPVNDLYILEIDRKQQHILINAPEGLIETYLE